MEMSSKNPGARIREANLILLQDQQALVTGEQSSQSHE